MQIERRPPQPAQEIQIVRLAPEQALHPMQHALMEMLQELPTPITITEQTDSRQRTYYIYQVGEPTEDHPFGLGIGATPDFLDAVGFSLEKAMQTKPNGKQ